MHLPVHPERSVARRTALKRLAAGGAVAWTAPAVLSSRALAQSEACTPKCIPQIAGTPTATASATCNGNGANRQISAIVTLTGGVTASCPCDGGNPATLGTPIVTSTAGTATIAGNVVTISLGRGFSTTFDVTVSVAASCDDLDDTTCSVTCSSTFTVNVTVPNQGNCNGVGASVTQTTAGCS